MDRKSSAENIVYKNAKQMRIERHRQEIARRKIPEKTKEAL